MNAMINALSLQIDLTPDAERLVEAAARAEQRSVSAFILEAAISRAQEKLPDREHFGLNAEQWAAFQAALDAPPRPLPRMAKLMQQVSD